MFLRSTKLFACSCLANILWLATAFADPTIISRQQWGAGEAIANRNPPVREVSSPVNPVVAENVMALREKAIYLTVHHSEGTPRSGEDPKIRLKRNQTTWQSRAPGSYRIDIKDRSGRKIGVKTIYMGDIPYHFVIAPAGQILEGRELKYSARSNTVYDKTQNDDLPPISHHITIVLEGELEANKPAQAQLDSLVELLHFLASKHQIKINNITYHRMIADTTCPGQNMIKLMPGIRQKLHDRGIPGDLNAPCDGCKPARVAANRRLFGGL